MSRLFPNERPCSSFCFGSAKVKKSLIKNFFWRNFVAIISHRMFPHHFLSLADKKLTCDEKNISIFPGAFAAG